MSSEERDAYLAANKDSGNKRYFSLFVISKPPGFIANCLQT